MTDPTTPNTTIYKDTDLTVHLTLNPTTAGHTIATLTPTTNSTSSSSSSTSSRNSKHKPNNLFHLPQETFLHTLLTLRTLTTALQKANTVTRTALITTGGRSISLLPLHGVSAKWQPITHATPDFHAQYPGYITSKSAPQMATPRLNTIRSSILFAASVLPTSYHADHTFHGGAADDQNLFARIVRGEHSPQWRVWEDERHVAFLTPFANTPGFTVVVPRVHLSSDIFSLNERDYAGLMEAAYTVGRLLIRAFGVERCGMIFEGFEIDYAHVKLVPIHGFGDDDDDQDYQGQEGLQEPFQEVYQGYVSSLPGPRVEDVEGVVKMAREIRGLIESEPVGCS
ncbi:HIT family protein [Aspergillus homomorphus CBS 101889]|uniref:HIT-like protein n=1 Tax=Aspergillus homomorphus (strain CBS 101889) TaxID=1450537 RepID=A0A395HQC6_ASPHC|nr:HIT-like protein [Aspergillus homomorphus CBS 101889]RAL09699.1 HIT-like protein [Aspergillus homomorphus CBS 101889]